MRVQLSPTGSQAIADAQHARWATRRAADAAVASTLATSLPDPSLELEDELPDDSTDCAVCRHTHDSELHQAVQALRAYLRADLARRLDSMLTLKTAQQEHQRTQSQPRSREHHAGRFWDHIAR